MRHLCDIPLSFKQARCSAAERLLIGGSRFSVLKFFELGLPAVIILQLTVRPGSNGGMNMNGKTADRCISTEKDLGPFLRRFVLPAAVLCAIALGIVGIVWHSQETAPLTEADVLAAMQRTGLPLELSADGTKSWGEGHVLYTLTGEDIQVIISCALAGGERSLQMQCLSQEEEMPELSLEDWRPYLSLALILFDGALDSETVYGTLSNETMTESDPAKADADGWAGLKTLSWKGPLSDCYGTVTWRRYGTHVTRAFPSPVIHRWADTFSVFLCGSEEAYQGMRQQGP